MTTLTCECGKQFQGVKCGRCSDCKAERVRARAREQMRRFRKANPRTVPTVSVVTKCPRCPDGSDLHTVEMDRIPKIMPRLFCDRHQILKTIIYADAYNGTTVRI